MNTLRSIKRFWWVALLAAGVQPALGFALLGPLANGGDSWQVPTIGYGQPYTEYFAPGGPVNLGDIGGPKNLGEGYRRNTPVIYYTYDANYLNYFGSNGVAAVDGAFAIMNKAFTTNPVTGQYLTNGVDSYSPGLSEYPPDSLHINYEAQSLALTDLKSVTLHCLVEQLGLAAPERFTWTLAERFDPPGCPVTTEYLVVQRNYDITASPLNQLQYSPYVNDTLYTYQLDEWCTPAASPEPPAVAYTAPFNADPFAKVFTAVAANTADGLGIGAYFAGLTRDDVAGFRYLLTTNNRVWETAAFIGATTVGNSGAGAATLQTTNLAALTLVTSANLSALLTAAQVNNPALIPGLFPGVVVGSSSNYYAVVCTTNLAVSIQNQNYGAPYPDNFGTPSYTSVVNCGYQQFFSTTFANIVTSGNLTNNPNISLASTNITLTYSTNTVVTYVTTSLTPKTGQPYPPPPQTNANYTYSTTTINVPSGEYLILPAGACGFKILSELPLPTVYTTNLISTATNANGFVDTVSTVTSFTPHQFLVQPIDCTSTPFSTGLYEGIEGVQFAKANYDSLLGQFFQPVTNNYTMTMITNSQTVVQKFQRIATAPDILLTAADDIGGNTFNGTVTRNITLDQDNIGAGLAGPGTINPRTTISYNKVGSAFENGYFLTALDTNAFLLEANQMPVLQWASFGASTNDPVLYPDGTSIANLESQVLIQVTPPPPTLPDGTNGAAYPATPFSAAGGAFTPPYTWGLVSGLGAPPPGLSLSGSGIFSGTPTQAGTFDFTVQLTDSLGRSVNWNYTITIH
jgi:hypothetical protein